MNFDINLQTNEIYLKEKISLHKFKIQQVIVYDMSVHKYSKNSNLENISANGSNNYILKQIGFL